MMKYSILDDGMGKHSRRSKVTIVVADASRNLYSRVFAENVQARDAEELVKLLNLHHDIEGLVRMVRSTFDQDSNASEAKDGPDDPILEKVPEAWMVGLANAGAYAARATGHNAEGSGETSDETLIITGDSGKETVYKKQRSPFAIEDSDPHWLTGETDGNAKAP